MANVESEMQDDMIQVSGNANFPQTQWRKALLHFLFGMWGMEYCVTYRPKVDLVGGGFRYQPESRSYTCTPGNSKEELWPVRNDPRGDFERTVDVAPHDSADTVETSLIRFVKNDNLRRLTLHFHCGHRLILTKGPKRGDLQVVTQAP